MDENTSPPELNSSPLLKPDLIDDIVSFGFSPRNYREYVKQAGREPSLEEITSPAYLLSELSSRQAVSPELYRAVGKKIASSLAPDYYLQRCPPWLHFQAVQRKETLVKTVEKSLEGFQHGNGSYDYVPGLAVWTTSPDRYQRLENTSRKIIVEDSPCTPVSKTSPAPARPAYSERLYVSYLEWSGLNYEKAVSAFKKFYELLSDKKIELHNNKKNLHQEASSLDAAVKEVSPETGTIAKIDSPRVNLYLKPNASYHIRIDVLGTKEEILAFARKLEGAIQEIYLQEKESALKPRKPFLKI